MAFAGKIENGMNISHLSKTLVCGDASEEIVMKEISVMPMVSHIGGVYCLKGGRI